MQIYLSRFLRLVLTIASIVGAAGPLLAGSVQCYSIVKSPVQETVDAQHGYVRLLKSWLQAPLTEIGSFRFSSEEIAHYFQTNAHTSGTLKLNRTLDPSVSYKINERGQYQARNWYTHSEKLSALQQQWSTNIDAFIEKQGTSTFNDAKKKFYQRYPFNFKLYHHELPHQTLREWGELNHPPLSEVEIKKPDQISQHYKAIDYSSPKLDSSQFFQTEFQKKMDQVSQSELTIGNTFKLLNDSESFHERLRLIEGAKKSIWMSSLVFVEDATTTQVAEALIKRHKEGIEVKIIVENMIRRIHPQLVKRMISEGIEVIRADDFFNFNSQAIYHTKTAIFDGEIAIVGGMNMLDADLGSNGTDFKNRDHDVRFKGPVVTDVMANFAEDWNHFASKASLLAKNRKIEEIAPHLLAELEKQKASQRGQGLRGASHYSTWMSDRSKRMSGIARYIAQKPYKNMNTITDAYLGHLDGVTEYLGFTNPQALDTRKETAERGLRPIHNAFTNFNRLFDKLQMIQSQKPQVHVDQISSGARFVFNESVSMTVERIRSYLEKDAFLRANLNHYFLDNLSFKFAGPQYRNLIRDYAHFPNTDVWLHASFIHSKIFYFDRIAVSIGSFNPHHNATDHAYEATLIIQDAAFNASIDRAMTLDMANSAPLVYSEETSKKEP